MLWRSLCLDSCLNRSSVGKSTIALECYWSVTAVILYVSKVRKVAIKDVAQVRINKSPGGKSNLSKNASRILVLPI